MHAEGRRADVTPQLVTGDLEQLFEAAPDAIVLVDDTGRVIRANTQFMRLFGYTPDEILGQSIDDLTAPPGRRAETQSLTQQIARGASVSVEAVRRRKDGSLIQVSMLGTPIRTQSGQVAVYRVYRDITARKATQDALRRSEAKYREFIERATFGVYRSTRDGRFVEVNPALVKMLGYETETEVLDLDIARDLYIDPAEGGRIVARYQGAEGIDGLEVKWKRKDGKPITVRLSGRFLAAVGGEPEGFEMIAEDVTEQRNLEGELHQAQKMEAVGQLTGGIAHDFNNILTVILANADLVSQALPEDPSELRSDLEQLQSAARRGAEMVRKLLAFSRREKLDLRPVNLAIVVKRNAEIIGRLVPDNMELHVVAEEEAGTVRADAGAVEQILLNLITNAADAMAGGGILRVETVRGRLTEEDCAAQGWGEPGEYACLSVSDTGVGMDDATEQSAFEPFFTTKPPGEGTGLGMPMVYGLVKQQGGFVHLYSEPGAGTTVTAYFPVIEDPAAAIPARRETALRGGTETILVADDEEVIRRAAKRILERSGYNVLTAADGAEALNILRANEGKIDLVFSDVAMPNVGGRELYESVRGEGNEVPFLFTSGYTARYERESVAFDPKTPFLRKPWALDELVLQVRAALDEARRPT